MAIAEQDRYAHARQNAKAWFENIEEMLAAVHAESEDSGCGVADDAERGIHESVLSVQVRSDWHDPGTVGDGPTEYCILLSTGGPALRIIGDLDQYGQPSSAEMQMQDWGVEWQRYPAPEDTLLDFAGRFWFTA
jgi:hypothetical protein